MARQLPNALAEMTNRNSKTKESACTSLVGFKRVAATERVVGRNAQRSWRIAWRDFWLEELYRSGRTPKNLVSERGRNASKLIRYIVACALPFRFDSLVGLPT